MFDSLFSWLLAGIGEALEHLTNSIMGVMELSLSKIVSYFPVLPTAYRIFQAVGIVLVILIAGRALIAFSAFSTLDTRDFAEKPTTILFRSFIAIALIFFGNYVVELLIQVAKIPFNIFNNLNAVQKEGLFTALSENPPDAMWNGKNGAVAAIGTVGQLLILLVFTIVIGWNIIKLILEVCERFALLGIMAYMTPLIFPTLASTKTKSIFDRACQMFFSGCIMMMLSAFFFKVIYSCFSFLPASKDGPEFWGRLFISLAVCKIAQRVDTYMQQIGMSTALTGGNIAGDMAIAATTLGSFISGRNPVGNGVRGAVSRKREAVAQGLTGDAVRQAARSGFWGGFTGNPRYQTAQEANSKAERYNAEQRAQHQQRSYSEAQRAYSEQQRRYGSATGSGVDPDRVKRDLDSTGGDRVKEENARAMRTAYGTAIENAGFDTEGGLNNDAKMRGFTMDSVDENGAGVVHNADKNAVPAWVAGNYSAVDSIKDDDVRQCAQESMKMTATEFTPGASTDAMMNPNYDLSGNDEVGTILMNKGFQGVAGNQEVEFHDIKKETLDNVTKEDGQVFRGGQCLSANYDTPDGQTQQVKIYDSVAYHSMTPEQQEKLTPYVGANNQTYYYNTEKRVETQTTHTNSSQSTPPPSPNTPPPRKAPHSKSDWDPEQHSKWERNKDDTDHSTRA